MLRGAPGTLRRQIPAHAPLPARRPGSRRLHSRARDDYRIYFRDRIAAGLQCASGWLRKPCPLDCSGGVRMTFAAADPVELAIFQSAVHSIAEEMGAALRRTALSPNIKERRDYSCALFDAQARVIAMGDHMPVHLGSMPMSVQAAVAAIAFAPGDIAILNDPYAGGTHLPDITMVLPVFLPGHDQPVFYVSNRAHHADVGGSFAGSMGPAREIFQEGIRIPPVRIVRGGVLDREILNLILLNVRTPQEREGDLASQIGACRVGEQRLLQLAAKYGEQKLQPLVEELLDYSERLVRAELRTMPAGDFSAEDWLDDDGVTDIPCRIAVRLRFDPEAASLHIDFAGSSAQVGRPRDGRHSASAHVSHSPRQHRRCSASRAGRRRQRRNLAAHCRRA